MNCPGCGGTMQAVSYESIEVDRCSTCHGIWFDALELDKLTEIAGSELIDPPPPLIAPSANTPKRNCPHCSNPMIGMTAHGQPHIRFESCTVCYGAFLDAGEFRDLKSNSLIERLRNFFRLS